MLNHDPYCGVQCAECSQRMFSYWGHDYKTCGCPNETMVDGGKEYLRYGWAKVKPTVIEWDEKIDGKIKRAYDKKKKAIKSKKNVK